MVTGGASVPPTGAAVVSVASVPAGDSAAADVSLVEPLSLPQEATSSPAVASAASNLTVRVLFTFALLAGTGSGAVWAREPRAS